jgi:hypothetical protein
VSRLNLVARVENVADFGNAPGIDLGDDPHVLLFLGVLADLNVERPRKKENAGPCNQDSSIDLHQIHLAKGMLLLFVFSQLLHCLLMLGFGFRYGCALSFNSASFFG